MREKFLRNPYLHLALIAIVGLAAYANTFDVPFQWDDVYFFRDSKVISDFFHSDALADEGAFIRKLVRTRYVGFLGFALNYAAHGGSLAGYHAVNIGIHIICAALVYALVLLTFGTPSMRGARLFDVRHEVALAAALLFVAHPVQTQAVTYIYQRLTSMAAMFYLGAVAAYAAHRLSVDNTRGRVLYALCIVSALLGMFTKPIVFTLPIAIVMYELYFFGRPDTRRLKLLAPVVALIVVIPIVAIAAGGGSTSILEEVESSTRVGSMPRGEYFVTQFRVLMTYLRMLVLPLWQNIDHDYPLGGSLADPMTFLSFAAVLGLLALTSALYSHAKRRNSPDLLFVSFGMAWFFLTISLESSVVPLMNVIFEHRLYLPSAGIIPAAVVVAYMLSTRRDVLRGVLIVVLMVFVSLTLLRNAVWGNEISLWHDAARKSPSKARTQVILARKLLDKGMRPEAAMSLKKATELDPSDVIARYNLGMIFMQEPGGAAVAERYFRKVIELDPTMAGAYYNLGMIMMNRGDNGSARVYFEESLRLDPKNIWAARFLESMSSKEPAVK